MKRTLLLAIWLVPQAVLAIGLMVAAPAQAAPVTTGATLRVSLEISGIPVPLIEVQGGGVVDVTGTTVTIPAGLVSLGQTIVIPVTASTAFGLIAPFTIRTLSNLAGTFSLGGVTAQAPGEVCPGGAGVGEACNAGGGVGGTMALAGRIMAGGRLYPGPFAIVDFDNRPVGQGGSTNTPFTLDAAAWSTGPGFVGGTPFGTTVTGSGTPFNLVSPTYLSMLGTEASLITSLTLTAVSLPVPETSLWALLAAGLAGLLWKNR